MNVRVYLILAGALLMTAFPVASQEKTAKNYPESFNALMECRNIAAAEARLACFDARSSALASAVQAGDVALADKAQITETKKELFGFSTQNVKIFQSPDGRDSFEQIEDVIKAADQLNTGQWTLTLPNGAVWMQIDTALIAVDPKPGMKISIRRAAMGSFMARIGQQPAIRVRRIR